MTVQMAWHCYRYDSDDEEDSKIAPDVNDLQQETADLSLRFLTREEEEAFIRTCTEELLFEEFSAYEQSLSGVPFPKTVKRLKRTLLLIRNYMSHLRIPYLGQYISHANPAISSAESLQTN